MEKITTKNIDTRRSALKKLGLGTGAVYVAPAVTALMVPQHATATSTTSGATTAAITVFRYVLVNTLSSSESNMLTVGIDTSVLSSVNSSTAVTAFGQTIPYAGNYGAILFFKKTITPAPFSSSGSYQVTIAGTNYTTAGTYIASQ